jgi:hypothetical protein
MSAPHTADAPGPGGTFDSIDTESASSGCRPNPGTMRHQRSKWLYFIAFMLAAWAGLGWLSHLGRSRVEAHPLVGHVVASSVALAPLQRGLSFPLLFAHGVPSPFSFSVRLPTLKKGDRAVWLYASQAPDHGQLSFEHEGRRLGAVDNQLKEPPPAPVLKLSRIGDLKLDARELQLTITGSHPALERHFAELGLLVLAPPGLSEGAVLAALRGGGGMSTTDLGGLLLVLAAVYGGLFVLGRQGLSPAAHAVSALVLAGLAGAAVAGALLPVSAPPLDPDSANGRAGIEKLLDTGLVGAVGALDRWQGGVLPDRQVRDEVPAALRSSRGRFESDLFHSPQAQQASASPVSGEIFSGAMVAVQRLPAQRLWTILGALGGALLVLAALDRRRPSRVTAGAALGVVCAASVLLSVRLSQGWDEFFINLRHAYMLLHHGVYSVNAGQMIEATVDFLPLALTAALGAVGVDLVDAFVASSLLGNVGVVVFSYLIVKRLTGDRTWALLGAVLVGLYPNVLWVGGSGFSAVLFSAWLLAASYFLLFTGRRLTGLCLLATLTLVRTEGVLFAALVMAALHAAQPWPALVRSGAWRPALATLLKEGALVAAPFVLSLGVRKLLFGHAIPNPVTFKNTHLDSAYLSVGLERLLETVATHDLHWMALLAALLGLACWASRRGAPAAAPAGRRRRVLLSALTLVFILPYHVGGGDWFPVRWNRYGMPFNLTLVILLLVLLYRAFAFGLQGWVRGAGLAVTCLALVLGYARSERLHPGQAVHETWVELAKTHAESWGRVDKLAALGLFLKDVLPPDAVVASPEEATLMYFSERDMMGLLGVSTPQIAAMPFQPLKAGDILHRRRGHAAVFRQRPDVIALYEPVSSGDFPSAPDPKQAIHQTVQKAMFHSSMVDVAYYRVGSFPALEKMGYRHLSVAYPDKVLSLFVHDRIRAEMVRRMRAAGFQSLGSAEIAYQVDPRLSATYVPAVPELMTSLQGQ